MGTTLNLTHSKQNIFNVYLIVAVPCFSCQSVKCKGRGHRKSVGWLFKQVFLRETDSAVCTCGMMSYNCFHNILPNTRSLVSLMVTAPYSYSPLVLQPIVTTIHWYYKPSSLQPIWAHYSCTDPRVSGLC